MTSIRKALQMCVLSVVFAAATPYAYGNNAPVDTAEPLTMEEMEALFQEAQQNLRNQDTSAMPTQQTEPLAPPIQASVPAGDAQEDITDSQIITFGQQKHSIQNRIKAGKSYIPLRDVDLRLAFNDATINSVMEHVTSEINRQSGPWRIQWRLTHENRDLINKKVNLNAESTFDEFLSHFTSKVNNLTGVRLFVKVFEASRVIIIADTF